LVPLGGLVKLTARLHLRVSDSAELRWSPKIFISTKFIGDSTTGPKNRTHFKSLSFKTSLSQYLELNMMEEVFLRAITELKLGLKIIPELLLIQIR
jgi:hypothetical protein